MTDTDPRRRRPDDATSAQLDPRGEGAAAHRPRLLDHLAAREDRAAPHPGLRRPVAACAARPGTSATRRSTCRRRPRSASAWDPDIARRYGAAAAVEARRKGVDVVLGPTINLHRSPLGGRHFECFSEDPVLTADLAAAYVARRPGQRRRRHPEALHRQRLRDRPVHRRRPGRRARAARALPARLREGDHRGPRLAGDELLQLGQRRHRHRERPARDPAQQRVGLRRRRGQRLDRRPQPRQRQARRRTW